MNEDPIITEIRRHRVEHAERYGHDLGRICEALRKAEAKSGHEAVHRPVQCEGSTLASIEIPGAAPNYVIEPTEATQA